MRRWSPPHGTNRVPLTFDTDVGFVDTPTLVRRFEVRPKTSLDLGSVALDPSPDGYMIEGQAPLAAQAAVVADAFDF